MNSLAYTLLAVPPLYTLSQYSPRARYYLRLSTYLTCLTAAATWGLAVAASMALVGKKYDVNWVVARSFYSLVRPVLGLEVVLEVEGESGEKVGGREGEEKARKILEGERPAVLMMNHQSMLDLVLVGNTFPKRCSIVSKSALQYTPVGPFMLLSGAVFLDRTNNRAAVASLQAAARALLSNSLALWMFPEGTRSMRPEAHMLPLKKGGFHLAIQAGIPIVPLVAENYWRMYRPGVFEEGTIRVRVLKPIPTKGLTEADAGALALRVHEVMLAALKEISVAPDSSPDSDPTNSNSKEPESLSTSREQTPSPMPIMDDPVPSNVAMPPLSPLSTPAVSSYENSEHGTEEDEDMVLVPRPA